MSITTKQKHEVVRLTGNIYKALKELSEFLDSSKSEDLHLMIAHSYPFAQSLEEVMAEVSNWTTDMYFFPHQPQSA